MQKYNNGRRKMRSVSYLKTLYKVVSQKDLKYFFLLRGPIFIFVTGFTL